MAGLGATTQIDVESTSRQFREFLSSYNKLTEMCFMDCINDFTSRKISNAEDTCALNCMEKYMKMTQRISQRFQESQLLSTDAAGSTVQNLKSAVQ
ncbi:hypothetical protein ACJMK2_037116 [Sinanodonta woodiana]|uniref:Mitochondrial import inner membrane translocase subunit n=1 Tax=Sinanodonta woodiana TaxID=1069815 RepID=A0ABD3WJA3_SINWO